MGTFATVIQLSIGQAVSAAWAITCHSAQRKWEMELQSEAPVAPNGTNGTGFNGKATMSQGSMRQHLLISICNVWET